MPDQTCREEQYRTMADRHGAAIARLASAYEKDVGLRQDLEQDIHMHLWRSLEGFAGECSLATWTWRVVHNVCARHVDRAVRSRASKSWIDIDTLEPEDRRATPEEATGAAQTLERLHALIERLRPLDRQVVLLYLEDVDAQGIAEVTGLSPGAVATRIHRIKALLAQGFGSEALT